LHVPLKNDTLGMVCSVTPNHYRLASTSEVFGKMEKRLSVSFREARYYRRRRQFTPTALTSTDNSRRYDFGDVMVTNS
jgi:hypothetical protein